jgi:type IV pilus assembly protein PilA
MKTELKAKFLQHILNKKKNEEGFTLIELLVVIIIIGILSAIALPSFLNQASKAKQSEGKVYVGSMNKGQQAYFTENDEFTKSVSNLGVGIKTQTALYKYNIATLGTGTDAYVVNYTKLVTETAPLKNYAGKVYLEKTASSGTGTSASSEEYFSVAFLCETLPASKDADTAVKAGTDALDKNTCEDSDANFKTIGAKEKKATK